MKTKNYTLTNDSAGLTVKVKCNNTVELSFQNTNFDLKKMAVDYDKICYRLARWEGDTLAYWQSRKNALEYTCEEAIVEGEKQLLKLLRKYNESLKNGLQNEIFLQLKPIVDKNVKHYLSDFYRHDNYFINNQLGNRDFIFIARESGTHLFVERDVWFHSVMRCFKNEIKFCGIYHQATKKFEEVTNY